MAGLRERQKATRHRDILEAAGTLFQRTGYAETSIEAIAERAEVAPGTVYNYFQSKGDLLLALVALDGEEVRANGKKLIARAPKDPMKAIRGLLESYVDHSLVHLTKELWRNAIATAITQPASPFGLGYAELDRKLADQVGELVASLQARGDISAEIDARIAGDILFEICNCLFVVFVTQEAMPIEEMKRRMTAQIDVVFAGLPAADILKRRSRAVV
ncbi:MAG TPA: TetR/AcrR family transcriptional regulator [Dongiaceae bacterium]|nr:TetR/AcrR family transcriptional regulator [Dongiaceae bacterium]